VADQAPQLGRAAAQGGRRPGQPGHPGVHLLLGLLTHRPDPLHLADVAPHLGLGRGLGLLGLDHGSMQPDRSPAGQLQSAQHVLVGPDHIAEGDRPLQQVAQVAGLHDHGQPRHTAGHVGPADLPGQPRLLPGDLVGGRLQGDQRRRPTSPGRLQLAGGRSQPRPGHGDGHVGGGQGVGDRSGVGSGVGQYRLDRPQAPAGLVELVPLVGGRGVGEQQERGDHGGYPAPSR
jgi:hypothetical protein